MVWRTVGNATLKHSWNDHEDEVLKARRLSKVLPEGAGRDGSVSVTEGGFGD